MWTSLPIYLGVWVLVPRAFLGAELWYVGVIWAVTYVGFHVYEIVVRRHCYLSADSTAAPAVLTVALLTALVLHITGVAGFSQHAWPYLQALVMAFGGGHLAALGYSALFSWLGGATFRASRNSGPWIEQGSTYRGLSRLSEVEREVRKRKRAAEESKAAEADRDQP